MPSLLVVRRDHGILHLKQAMLIWKQILNQLKNQLTTSDELPPLSDEQLTEQMAVLEEEGRRQRKRTETALKAVVLILGSVALFASVVVVVAALTGKWWLLSMLGICGFAGFAGFLSFFSLASKRQKEAARIVARGNDPRAIGPLADSLLINDAKIQVSVFEALSRLLPMMDESIAHNLGPERVDSLNRVLKGGYWQVATPWNDASGAGKNAMVFGLVYGWRQKQIDLISAAISASPLYGNTETLRLVRRYAATPLTRFGTMGQSIYTAAITAVPALEARIERLKQGDALLRPAEPLKTDSLLRPAASSECADEHVLLRPGSL